MLLVQNLLHGQQLDDSTRPPVERRALLLGVAGVAEGDEEAALAAALTFAFHDGFELVDVGAADLVGLLDLDGEPVIGEQAGIGRLGADGEDAAALVHVADLHLVGNPAQRDHRPVLELERRQLFQLLDRPRQVRGVSQSRWG